MSRISVKGIHMYQGVWFHSQGRGGGVYCELFIYRHRDIDWLQNFEFQFFGGFQKNEYLLGYEDFMDIF